MSSEKEPTLIRCCRKLLELYSQTTKTAKILHTDQNQLHQALTFSTSSEIILNQALPMFSFPFSASRTSRPRDDLTAPVWDVVSTRTPAVDKSTSKLSDPSNGEFSGCQHANVYRESKLTPDRIKVSTRPDTWCCRPRYSIYPRRVSSPTSLTPANVVLVLTQSQSTLVSDLRLICHLMSCRIHLFHIRVYVLSLLV